MKTITAYIAIGSNLGDKLANCKAALDLVEKEGLGTVDAVSRFYKTEPVDFLDQDWFVNAAAGIFTQKSPMALLEGLKRIEVIVGRKEEGIRFGPRILDLDIIFYGESIVSLNSLVIPHPRMHKRRFVLKPICDIDATIMHPVLKKDVQTLLDELIAPDQQVLAI